MIHLTIDDDKRLWVVDKYGKLRADTGGYLLYFGENEFEEIEISCVTNIHGNVIRHYDTSLVVMSDEERVYPVSFTLRDGALISDLISVDAAMTSRAGEIAVYVRFVYQEEFIGRTNCVHFKVRSGVCEDSHLPRTLRVNPKPSPQEFSDASGYDRVEVAAVEAEELTVVPEDARQVFLPSENRYFSKVTVERPELSLEDINVMPSNERQYITSDDDHFAIRSVRVEPISSALDLQIKRAAPATQEQSVTADGEYVALSEVRIDPVTASIDSHIQPENIRKDVTVLGVTGTMETVSVDPEDPETYVPTVKFYDYDGAPLGEYTADSLEALDGLPEPPSHDNLVFLRFNRTKQSILSYLRTHNRDVDAAALYRTSDGKTRLCLSVTKPSQLNVTLRFFLTSATVTVDFGDESSQTLTGSGNKTFTHTYAQEGDYAVKVSVDYGIAALGHSDSQAPVVSDSSSDILTAVEMGDNIALSPYSFYNCKYLRTVALPSGTNAIPDSAFNACRRLRYVALPENVATVGNSAFSYCTTLRGVCFPDNVSLTGTYMMSSCVYIEELCVPQGVTALPGYFINGGYGLKKLSLAATVRTIGQYAFSNCCNLERLILPQGVQNVGERSFEYCRKIEKLVLPSTLTYIGSYGFQSCISLKEITAEAAALSFGNYSFGGCTSLLRIRLLRSPGYGMFQNCYSLKEIEFGDEVNTLNDYTFYGCYSLRRFSVPPQIAAFSSSVFTNCVSLESIDFTRHSAPPTVITAFLSNLPETTVFYVASDTVRELFLDDAVWSTVADRILTV